MQKGLPIMSTMAPAPKYMTAHMVPPAMVEYTNATLSTLLTSPVRPFASLTETIFDMAVGREYEDTIGGTAEVPGFDPKTGRAGKDCYDRVDQPGVSGLYQLFF